MKSETFIPHGQKPGFGRLISVLFLSAVLGGCASTYGRFQPEPAFTPRFETGDIPSGYDYYLYGHANQYYAIAGLEPGWVVQSRFWKKITPGSEEFKRAVTWIWEDYAFRRHSAYILGVDGRRVGIWFSALRYPSVKFTGDQGVDLIPDMPFLWGPGASTAPGARSPAG